MRIGYVNVQGLSKTKGEAVKMLLGKEFDYLFIAETWYVDHPRWLRDRQLVAATVPPPKDHARDLPGRCHGGIYLLATAKARGEIRGEPIVTKSSLSFQRGKQRFTGVYFPPSLPPDELQAILQGLKPSTVVLGDINTRFAHCPHQAGAPGPPPRLQVISHWGQTQRYDRLLPDSNGTPQIQLTTDHAFARAGEGEQWSLTLLPRETLKIKTDHMYALQVVGKEMTPPIKLQSLPPRYRTARLQDPEVQRQIIADVSNQLQHRRDFFRAADRIEAINHRLIELLQNMCRKHVGLVQFAGKKADHSQTQGPEEPTMDRSIKLFKAAVTASQENGVVLPTPEAAAQGMSAVRENERIFRTRFADPDRPVRVALEGSDGGPMLQRGFSIDEITAEILHQEAAKACGVDRIHIRLLQVLVHSAPLVQSLYHLYDQCIRQRQTPAQWNDSEIHLLTKDMAKPRDASNVRPITLIGMFRKVFERLLLQRIEHQDWAHLHPTQAGFRRETSTGVNVAILHHLLHSRLRTQAVFIDLRSAFDLVRHDRLARILRQRQCPQDVARLIRHLMMDRVRSQVLINGEASEWFPRSRGVLQGSPLSPFLFNLYIDGLLERLNPPGEGIPSCLFYADDGVLIGRDGEDLQGQLDRLEAWADDHRMEVNVAKCGWVTRNPPRTPLRWKGERLPQVERYDYLGFEVTAAGVDFEAHLRRRMMAATNRMRFLSITSDPWGPAHRLRIYKRFLAPMFEYGAPLVQMWLQQDPSHGEIFDRAMAGYRDLMRWVAHSQTGRYRIIGNLAGLTTVRQRFQHLATAYQRILADYPKDHLFKRILDLRPLRMSIKQSFGAQWRRDPGWREFHRERNPTLTTAGALKRFLAERHRRQIQTQGDRADLTSLIPWPSRMTSGLKYADRSLAAPVKDQSLLFQYRLGVFQHRRACKCGRKGGFGRGHEKCSAWKPFTILTRAEKRRKREWQRERILLKTKRNSSTILKPPKLTDIDFLINQSDFSRATRALREIRRSLNEVDQSGLDEESKLS